MNNRYNNKNKKEFVNVVNINDRIIDVDEKNNCHKLGKWHRCSAIYIHSKESLIVQKRAKNKSIEAGKLDHSASGHVRMDESYREGAMRELYEELGIRLNLKKIGKTKHSQIFHDSCIDNQHYVVYTGEYDGNIKIDENELENATLFKFEDLENLIKNKPELFAIGFLITYPIFKRYVDNLNKK